MKYKVKEYVLVDWDNLTWLYIDLSEPEAFVQGHMDEPTFASVKKHAWAEGIAVGSTMTVVRGDGVAICRGTDTLVEG